MGDYDCFIDYNYIVFAIIRLHYSRIESLSLCVFMSIEWVQLYSFGMVHLYIIYKLNGVNIMSREMLANPSNNQECIYVSTFDRCAYVFDLFNRFESILLITHLMCARVSLCLICIVLYMYGMVWCAHMHLALICCLFFRF